ncbi:hypothetical protein ACKAV7_001948 [Fusarium commune]
MSNDVPRSNRAISQKIPVDDFFTEFSPHTRREWTECSKMKLCATGCCSSAGFCGTTKDHCGKGYLSTCDFKTECNKNNLCKGNACCSKFSHCGLGPDFCGKDCVAGCDAKGECDPGGFGSKFANHTKCPLNVCYSKHGYCGTTKDFCGKKTERTFCCPAGVTHPTCEWQFYNNGHCIPGCGPTSGFEVASSKRSCSSGYAQTACCKGNTKGLDVYRQYKWGIEERDIDWDNLEDLIKECVEKPTCPNIKFSDLEKGKLSSRSLDAMALDPDEQLFELTKRESLHKMSAGMTMVLIVQQVMQAQKNSRATREYRELLDKNLPKKWKHLVSTTFAGPFLFLQDAVSTLEVAWIWVCSVDEEEKWEEKKLKTNLRKPNSTSCSIPSLDFLILRH